MPKKLSPTPLLDPTAEITASTLGAYTEIGARTKLLEVDLGDCSYVVNDSEIAYVSIGKFTSIAAMTRTAFARGRWQRLSMAVLCTSPNRIGWPEPLNPETRTRRVMSSISF